MGLYHRILKNNRIYYTHTICYPCMGPNCHIGTNFCSRVYFRCRMYTNQPYNLIFFYCLWLSQYIFVYSLIVIEVNFLNMKHLLSFLDLLPKMFGLVKHKEACTALLFFLCEQGIYKVFNLYFLSAIIYLKLVCKLIETIKKY